MSKNYLAHKTRKTEYLNIIQIIDKKAETWLVFQCLSFDSAEAFRDSFHIES